MNQERSELRQANFISKYSSLKENHSYKTNCIDDNQLLLNLGASSRTTETQPKRTSNLWNTLKKVQVVA